MDFTYAVAQKLTHAAAEQRARALDAEVKESSATLRREELLRAGRNTPLRRRAGRLRYRYDARRGRNCSWDGAWLGNGLRQGARAIPENCDVISMFDAIATIQAIQRVRPMPAPQVTEQPRTLTAAADEQLSVLRTRLGLRRPRQASLSVEKGAGQWRACRTERGRADARGQDIFLVNTFK